MNAIPILESQLYSGYNENLLPEFMMFNEPFTWTVVSGSGTSVNSTAEVYEGARSLRIRANINQGVLIVSGGSQTDTPIVKDGKYILSWASFATEQSVIQIFVFVNNVSSTISYNADANDLNKWLNYFVELSLGEDDVVSFNFGAGLLTSDNPTYYIDGFKLEYDKYSIGIPTQFTPPTRTPLPTNPTGDGLYAIRVIGGVSTWETLPE